MRLIIRIYGLSRLPSCDSPLSFVLQMEILCGRSVEREQAFSPHSDQEGERKIEEEAREEAVVKTVFSLSAILF